MGGFFAIAGAAAALWFGLPALAAFAAYSLCGALGVVAGGLLNLAVASAPERAPAALAGELR
jgi:hypothetical protein